MSGPGNVFEMLELTEYEREALETLLSLGRTTAPNLAEATGIPKARIYGVLDTLSDRGFIKVIPGRPKEYQPKPPEEVLERAVENRRQDLAGFEDAVEERREAFLEEYRPRFERASEDVTPAAELFHVVDVGEPSERETRRIYADADRSVHVLSKAFEYFEAVRPAFDDAIERGVSVSVLLLDPDLLDEKSRAVQADIVDTLRTAYPSVGIRFSPRPLPWRGTFADPSMEYDDGTAILLVQEDDIPNHMRQAAITENGAFVAGLKRFFDLVWEYEAETSVE